MTLAWTCILLSLAVYMLWARFYASVEQERTRSAGDAMRQTQDLVRTRDAVIFGLAKLADSRDPETGDHLERIAAYSTALASALRRHPRFQSQVTPGFLRLIGISSALHDIGKVGVEDSILLKPGPLTAAERARMETHSTVGGRCLKEIEQRLGSSNFLQMAREIAIAHHERWDGTGYPQGLAGNAIPLAARIVAVADVYDALASKRVYKDPLPHDECVAIITRESGKQFDPDVIEVWTGIESRFRDIARRYPSAGPGAPGGVPERTVPDAKPEREQREECLVSTAAEG
jgi:putative two-component system response regulator